jgi:hypothetical protein
VAEGVHLALARGSLALVVGSDHGVVLDTHHGRVDPGIGEQLVDLVQAPDVPDLGDEHRTGRRADTGHRLEPSGQLGVEQRGEVVLGLADLSLEQVVLVEQQPDLEADLVVELGDRDGRGPASAWARVLVRRFRAAAAVGATRRTSRAVRRAGSSNSSPSSGKPNPTRRTRR